MQSEQPQQQMMTDTGQNEHDSDQQELHSKTTPAPPANNRTVLILREIDQNVPQNLVKEIFDNCPTQPIHCEHALHNSWYVSFENDEDARLALAYIRKHVVSWNGNPIMARYKPKPAVPSSVNQQTRPSMLVSDQHRLPMYPNSHQAGLPMINMLPNHQINEAPQHYGYSSVAYYGQHGQVMTPWHYTNGPQYDLSGIFVYNGLAPYASSNPKLTVARSKTVSSASLLGKPLGNSNSPLSMDPQQAMTYQSQRNNSGRATKNPT